MSQTPKKALIFGISGQDGAYLAKLLLSKGYEVHGTSRDAEMVNLGNLDALGICDQVRLLSAAPADFHSVLSAMIQAKPDEVYNLSGQSSVGLSFEQPAETLTSIALGTLNILDAIRSSGIDAKFYNASSSECFGHTGSTPADEETVFRPCSPYGIAKAAAHWEVESYRSSYGLFACSGILFNHESPLRPSRFVTQKIIKAAVRASQDPNHSVTMGNLDIRRDWGWAPEYVHAMWLMLQQDEPQDFVISTGQDYPLKDFVKTAFEAFDLDYRDFVKTDASFMRPNELEQSVGNSQKAKTVLGWEAKTFMHEVVHKMIEAELECQSAKDNGS
ncbi:GDP-mannose 4,6-dehydratase [Magnetovibrio sp. PR-2]|uniref:GDP-mannose 4,6-dehydratase n=1 Tax=Magnetovibrio sp. PR-2 TaxID=3120356 RepID=UPI002FCDF8BA